MSAPFLTEAMARAVEEREAAFDGASAPAALARRIRRKRVGASTVVASLAALAVGLTATVSVGTLRSAPVASDPYATMGTVTIPFDRYDRESPPDVLAGLVSCGASAPAVSLESEGFVLDMALGPYATTQAYVDATGTWSGTVTRATDTVAAVFPHAALVYVQGGVVVGYDEVEFWPQEPEMDYAPVGPDERHRTVYQGSSAFRCDGSRRVVPDENTWDSGMPEGTYTAYPVVPILGSPELAGREWLRERGFAVPAADTDAWYVFEPGSWDCSNQGPFPDARCAGDLVPSLQVDEAAQTITVPYPAGPGILLTSTYLVGEPYTVEVVDSGGRPYVIGRRDDLPPAPETGAGLRCGVATQDLGGSPLSDEPKPITYALLDDHLGLLTLSPRADVRGWHASFPDGLDVWLVDRPAEVRTYDSEGNVIAVQMGGLRVIGTAHLELAGRAPVALDRYYGPTEVPVVVSDVTTCPGFEGETAQAGVLEGRLVLDTGDGRPHTSTWFDEVWFSGEGMTLD